MSIRSVSCLSSRAALPMLVLLVACAPPGGGPGELGGEPLPAGMTSAEMAGKADGVDPRDEEPEIFGFTDPPASAVHLPGEFEPVDRVMIGWDLQSGFDLAAVMIEVVGRSLAEARVTVVTPSDDVRSFILEELERTGVSDDGLTFAKLDLDSPWIRDYGPLVVRAEDGGRHFVDLRYYWGRFADDEVPRLLARRWRQETSRPALEAEGGNVLSDGQGACLTTDVLLRRNAQSLGHDEDDVRTQLREHLGCETVIVLPPLLDESTGHVDLLAHVTGPGAVIVGEYDARSDAENAERLDQAARLLSEAGFVVTRVRMPRHDRRTRFRSYTNALAVNGVVFVPVYAEDRRYEEAALAVFADAYPGREIVPVEAEQAIALGGAVHCLTMTIAEP